MCCGGIERAASVARTGQINNGLHEHPTLNRKVLAKQMNNLYQILENYREPSVWHLVLFKSMSPPGHLFRDLNHEVVSTPACGL
jgi:hypothetical protein